MNIEDIRRFNFYINNQNKFVEKNLDAEHLLAIYAERSVDDLCDELSYLKTITLKSSKEYRYIECLQEMINVRELTNFLLGRQVE